MSADDIAAGDEVRCEPRPNRYERLPIEGVVVDLVNGGDGLNILCPLPGDPGRVVRAWRRDYEFKLVRKAAPPTPKPEPLPPMPEPPSVYQLAKRYALARLDDTQAWSQFVIDRGLRPEMDMRDFLDIVRIYR